MLQVKEALHVFKDIHSVNPDAKGGKGHDSLGLIYSMIRNIALNSFLNYFGLGKCMVMVMMTQMLLLPVMMKMRKFMHTFIEPRVGVFQKKLK